jgi:GR25 family glycosyltransferase involved in LPS biosynthesis
MFEGFEPQKKYLNGIDIIYWINLNRSVDRRNNMNKLLADEAFNGIPNKRISAFDGTQNPSSVFNKIIIESKKQTNSEYACLLSHMEAIRDFNNSDMDIALIFEDDVTLEFKKYWEKSTQEIMDNAPKDWDIILLSYIYYNDMSPRILFYSWDKNNKEYDRALNNYYSSLSYIINKKGSHKLIDNIYNAETKQYTFERNTVHVSDVYLEQITNAYAYKYPMFIYKSENDSTIHADHLPLHEKSKGRIVSNYKKLEDANKTKGI